MNKTGKILAGILFVVGLVATIACANTELEEFARAYLWAFLTIGCLPLGSLAFLMIYHTTGGRWGRPLVNLMRAAAATTPILLILFLPILWLLPHLYPWAQPDVLSSSPLWQHRAGYMNTTGYALRTLAALLAWSFLAWKLQTRRSDASTQKLASAGLVFHLLAVGLLSVDWLMSLDLHFSSTVFGLILIMLHAVTAFSFLIALACLFFPNGEPLSSDGPFYDLGGLLLAQIMLLGYVSFSQLVIVWSGNMAHEIAWYSSRVWGPWGFLAAFLLLVQLFLPFLLLLWGSFKRDRRKLGMVALGMTALAPLHMFWLVVPSFHPTGLTISWAYPATLLLMAGVWWLVFAEFYSRVQREAQAGVEP